MDISPVKIRDEAYQDLEDIIRREIPLKESREFAQAQKLYSEWIERYSKPAEYGTEERRKQMALALNNRGQLKYLGVDFDGAVEDYTKALSLDKELSSSYYNRGTIFYRMGYFDKATQDLRIATELSPEITEFKTALEQCQKELHNGS